jgi:hypothetical protein
VRKPDLAPPEQNDAATIFLRALAQQFSVMRTACIQRRLDPSSSPSGNTVKQKRPPSAIEPDTAGSRCYYMLPQANEATGMESKLLKYSLN